MSKAKVKSVLPEECPENWLADVVLPILFSIIVLACAFGMVKAFHEAEKWRIIELPYVTLGFPT